MTERELRWDDPLALEVVEAIHSGDLDALAGHFASEIGLASIWIVDDHGTRKTLMHVATDWPGNFERVADTIAWLAARDVPVDVPAFNPDGGASETPLHWAASADDVAAIDTLVELGADVEAPGAVFTNGTPMSDAVIFQKWKAAERLLHHSATTTLWQAAALDLFEQVDQEVEAAPRELRNAALWHACANGRLRTARRIAVEAVDWHEPSGDGRTPYEVATDDGGAEVLAWVDEVAPPPPK